MSIPIMVQDAPLMTQVSIPAPLLAKIGKNLQHVRYAKVEAPPTAAKITSILQQADGSISLLGGLNGNFLIEELDRGSIGIMPGSDLCAPFLHLWTSYQNKDRAQARSEFREMLPMIRYELQPGLGVSVMKLNLQARGIIDCSFVRPPTKTVDSIGVKELEELRRDLNL